MSRTHRLSVFLVLTCLVLFATLAGAQSTLAVPGAYPTIQGAINAAVDGDTVEVSPGTYFENIEFSGKGITVRSTGGSGVTTIDGGFAGSVVTFTSGEGTDSILEGFTITSGTGTLCFGAPCGGGIFCALSSPTIVGNLITGNTATYGGGIGLEEHCHPRIIDNVISNNTATELGAGIDVFLVSSPLIDGNEITDNICLGVSNPNVDMPGGGGIAVENRCSPTITDNRISGNTVGAFGVGGGVFCFYASSPLIAGNQIDGNSAYHGGGISCMLQSHPIIVSSTFHENSAVSSGGAIQSVRNSWPTVRNSILWANTALFGAAIRTDPVGSNSTVTHSDVEGGYAGTGNIDQDPLFVAALAGDFHLTPGSPCVGMGDSRAHFLQETDGDGGSRIYCGETDIGWDELEEACGYAPPSDLTCTISDDLVTLTWSNSAPYDSIEVARDGVLLDTLVGADTTFDDSPGAGHHVYSLTVVSAGVSCCGPGCRAPMPGTYHIDGAATPPGTGSVAAPYASIQFAIAQSESVNGSVLLVEPGVYAENIDFLGKEVVLRSVGGPGFTTIDGSSQTRGPEFASVVTFARNEGAGAVLDGFRVTAGTGTRYPFTASTQYRGGGVLAANGGPTIENNWITDNQLSFANGFGGGIFASIAPTIVNNTIRSNTALQGAGIMIGRAETTVIAGNVVAQNSAAQSCGGIVVNGALDASLTNNTIADNLGPQGAIRLDNSNTTVTNSILWNSAGPEFFVFSGAPPTVNYSCIQGGYPGTGNISQDPQFIDPAGGDYHLMSPGSPCIDAGDNGAPYLPQTDIDGGPRIVGLAADIGADETDVIVTFIRGDGNDDGMVDIADPSYTLIYLFGVNGPSVCLDAQDSNDDGVVNIADPVHELGWLFTLGPPPPPPFPNCGSDPTADGLDCLDYTFCP